MMDWFDLLNMDTTATEQPEWDVVSSNPNYTYADEYDKGFGGAFQTGPDAIAPEGKELFPGWTGTGATGLINALNRAGGAQALLGKGLDFATSKAGVAGIMALLAALDRQRASGGGAGQAYQGPANISRSVTQGKYGPIVRYAAEGGLMQAYANGGHVRPFPMQDGGFVMTGDAVKGIGGIENLQQILPEAQPITGPGTATSDSIPATIRGRNGITPAKVSNGEAYVPPGRDTKGLYALMRELERKA
jgi:hypothetical protein